MLKSIGSVDDVLGISNTNKDAYVAAIVTDEDSTTRSKLSHSYADLVGAERMTEAERRYEPKKAGCLGAKKMITGC